MAIRKPIRSSLARPVYSRILAMRVCVRVPADVRCEPEAIEAECRNLQQAAPQQDRERSRSLLEKVIRVGLRGGRAAGRMSIEIPWRLPTAVRGAGANGVGVYARNCGVLVTDFT